MELEYELLQNDLIRRVREALISLQWDGMVTLNFGAENASAARSAPTASSGSARQSWRGALAAAWRSSCANLGDVNYLHAAQVNPLPAFVACALNHKTIAPVQTHAI
jgi:hypothetical protein